MDESVEARALEEPSQLPMDNIMRERIELAKRAHSGLLLEELDEQQRRIGIAKRARSIGLKGLLTDL